MEQETFIDSFGKPKLLQLRFDRTARTEYKANSLEELFADDFKLLLQFIDHHRAKQVPRLRELYDYAEGNNHGVLEGERRRLEDDATDTRAVHNFGKAAATFIPGYIVGNPVQISYTDENIHERIQEVARANDFAELDRTLMRDMVICGRAYDITYRNQKDETKVRRLDPIETFVVFDNTLGNHSLCAVRYYSTSLFNEDTSNVEIFTDSSITTYELVGGKLTEINQDANFFGDVQITQHKWNLVGMGSYETELPLMDLYDAAQSDTANYMKDLSDAILFISGRMAFPEGLTPEQQKGWLQGMKKARLMLGEPEIDEQGRVNGDVDAKYIYKQYDVAGTEAYKNRIASDIHKFMNVPDLTDENFGGNQSGEAMKYKLFGLEQERLTAESLFRKGLTRRIELIVKIESIANNWGEFDPTQLTVTFTPNKTLSEVDVINTARSMYGMTSDLTVLEQVSKATGISAEDELERIENESEPISLPRREPMIDEVVELHGEID